VKVKSDLDTVGLCNALGVDVKTFEKMLHKARIRNGPMRQGVFLEQMTPAQTARFQENQYLFDGFDLVQRYNRRYPKASAGLILGYTGEVSPAMLKQERYKTYRQGDYTGMHGLERTYEEVLRGQRGVYYFERDNYNRPREPYRKGTLDTQAVAGRSLQLYLDAELQAYVEKLFVNKIGSAVAIDPRTGGILAMVTSPSYDPNLLQGPERARNFSKLYSDATKPLLNRATQAAYQPGSTLKPMTALVALDVGAISPSYGYPCGGGYYSCGRRIGCTHSGGGHAANLRLAIANSCNAYFVHIFRLIVDNKKFGGVKNGLAKWHDYFSAFGFGHPTGVDLPFEGGGLLPDTALYNKMYRGSWNSCTNLFVGMGQGEIALTPIQMANAMCIIANRGFYYTPHFVRSIDSNTKDPLLRPYLEKHVVTRIPDDIYTLVGLGMQDVVDKGTGRVAQLEGLEICAKTGTVENKAVVNGVAMKMKDHSMFVAYAPRENPTIAIAVAVENAGFGATWAGPIASLMMEKYLFDSIAVKRKHLEDRLLNANLIDKYTYIIDAEQRERDRLRMERRMAERKHKDSIDRYTNPKHFWFWIEKYSAHRKQKPKTPGRFQ
jgi:penicillin-binding protein 2